MEIKNITELHTWLSNMLLQKYITKADLKEAINNYNWDSSIPIEALVMQKQADTDLLKIFMKNHNCRLSYEDKWLVKDDATAVWHVYQQKYHKKVKQILTTEDLQEALSLLSA